MTLQIEEGKFYRTRNGEKAGPAQSKTSLDQFSWLIPIGMNRLRYDSAGKCAMFETREHDVVAEWVGDDFAKEYRVVREDKGLHSRAITFERTAPDPINHPPHYTGHPSGVECIQITEHMNFCRGNAMKYLWRAGEKGSEIEDLKKARWYLDREIARLEKGIDSLS